MDLARRGGATGSQCPKKDFYSTNNVSFSGGKVPKAYTWDQLQWSGRSEAIRRDGIRATIEQESSPKNCRAQANDSH